MKKIYYSPSGNRRIYVRIGEIPYVNNGRTEMIPENACCQFGSAGVGRYITDDERIHRALEAHPSFNRDFILFEGKAAELLANVKTLKEVVPNAAQIAEREELVREAKALHLQIDLLTEPTENIRAAIKKHKIELEARMAQLKTPPEVPEAPVVKEAKEMPEVDAPRRRGRRPKLAEAS